jgi:hypothetical protein
MRKSNILLLESSLDSFMLLLQQQKIFSRGPTILELLLLLFNLFPWNCPDFVPTYSPAIRPLVRQEEEQNSYG